ncbi:hypothetical protein PIB30_016956 [Stylosanthes scabra]|uniref:Uncharacterized protein n=1 Tax=Stylosanthes scabra TaxID=79078 RepID=A0ABU6Y7W4_9FABA|nr:hypothetical protein [Stylosanthes scabra]
MSSTEFVEMLVLDGCFVLEILRGVAEKEGFEKLGYSNNDPVFSMNRWIHSIRNDMMMLENQLPLFVLERLLRLQLGRSKLNNYFKLLVSAFFEPLAPASEAGKISCKRGLVPVQEEELRDRVEFKKRETGRFWDIEFKNGIMRMPRLLIHDGTRSLFLNLIAFEQCHLDSSNDITSYVIFMDNLINSPADVGYLHYCGIIEHWLGSDAEVADMFNRLCQDVAIDNDNSYLSALSKEVHEYYKTRWHTWCATLRHNHFANPWAITSLVAGVVLLLLTFAQTFYTIYAYYRPPHTSSKQ